MKFKKTAAATLSLVMLLSLTGCVSKTEYDKLLAEKKAIEEKSQTLATNNVMLGVNIKKLEEEKQQAETDLNAIKAENEGLRSQYDKLLADVKALTDTINGVKAENEELKKKLGVETPAPAAKP